MASWHIAQGEDVQGPYTDEQMRDLARGGRLKPHMHISKDGGAWQPALEVAELSTGQAPPAPPPLGGPSRDVGRSSSPAGGQPLGTGRPGAAGHSRAPARRDTAARWSRRRSESSPGTLRVGAFLCWGLVAVGLLGVLMKGFLLVGLVIAIAQPPLLFLAYSGVDVGAGFAILIIAWAALAWPVLWLLVLKRIRGAWYTLIVTTVIALLQWLALLIEFRSGVAYLGSGVLLVALPALVHGVTLACLLAPASRRFLSARAPLRRRTAQHYADTFE